MQIEARELWKSCWRAARVEYAAMESHARFNGLRQPSLLRRCHGDHPVQKLAYHILDIRTVNDLPGYRWITEHQGRFMYLRQVLRVPTDDEVPF